MSQNSSGREHSLDSLRGVAALLVAISHLTIAGLYKVEPMWGILKWSPLKILWSGHQAVILFFVLSGYALTKMLQSIGSGRYGTYLFARVLRLYPPYIFSLILGFLIYSSFQNFIDWRAGWMNVPKPEAGSVSVLGHVMMVGYFNSEEINGPIWSIVHEMRISVIFPLIYLLVRQFATKALVGFAVLSLLLSWSISGVIPLTPIQRELLISLHYTTFFALGSYIAQSQPTIGAFFEGKITRKWRFVLWVVALALYAYPFDNPWSLSQRMIGDLGVGSGGAIIISLILSSHEHRVLDCFRFLGRISYSFYLNHYLALSISLLVLYDRWGSIAVWIATLPLAMLISTVAYYAIELPALQVSRRLRKRASSRSIAAKAA